MTQIEYNLYNKNTGGFIGSVKEYSHYGAIKWGAFWYRVSEADVACVLAEGDTGEGVVPMQALS